MSGVKPGKFTGDMLVQLDFNPAEQTYRVRTFVWRQPTWKADGDEFRWFLSRDNMFDEGGVAGERTFPAKRRDRAIKWYLKVYAMRKARRLDEVKQARVAAGWQAIA